MCFLHSPLNDLAGYDFLSSLVGYLEKLFYTSLTALPFVRACKCSAQILMINIVVFYSLVLLSTATRSTLFNFIIYKFCIILPKVPSTFS